MTKEELATLLNGRQYGHEITKEEEAEAKASGLVVIFGASDDLMEFRGAIDDEVGIGDWGFVRLTSTGILQNECRRGDCPYHARIAEANPNKIFALWDCDGYSWVYETELPHATFDIMEDDEKYCRGIALELPKKNKEDGEGL